MSHVHSFHWFFIHTNATLVINPAVCGYGFSDLSFRFTSIQFTFKKQSQDFTTESNKFVLYAISDTQRVWMFHWVVKNTFFYSTICATWWKIQQYSWVYCDERSYATEFNSRLLLSKERLITQKLIYLILLIEQFCKDFCSLITSIAVIHTLQKWNTVVVSGSLIFKSGSRFECIEEFFCHHCLIVVFRKLEKIHACTCWR